MMRKYEIRYQVFGVEMTGKVSFDHIHAESDEDAKYVAQQLGKAMFGDQFNSEVVWVR